MGGQTIIILSSFPLSSNIEVEIKCYLIWMWFTQNTGHTILINAWKMVSFECFNIEV